MPSWVIDKIPSKIILEEEDQFSMRSLITVTNDFTENKCISELSDISKEQRKNKNLARIIAYIESETDQMFWIFDKNNEIDHFL